MTTGKATPTLGLFWLPLNRREHLIKANPMKHLHPDAVNNCEGHLGSVLVGSICTGKGRLPKGASTTLTMASATAPTVGVLGRDCGEGFLDRWHAGMSTLRKAVGHRNNPPNCPPTSALLVLKLKFYTKILA